MNTLLLRLLELALLFTLSLAGSAGPVSADAAPAGPVRGTDLGAASAHAPAAPAPVSHAMRAAAGRHGPMRMAHAGHAARGSGIVNAVDATARTVNLSHGPIAALGWPPMTMDFAVAPETDLRALQPGTRVDFTIEHGADDRYVIQSLTPAGGGNK